MSGLSRGPGAVSSVLRGLKRLRANPVTFVPQCEVNFEGVFARARGEELGMKPVMTPGASNGSEAARQLPAPGFDPSTLTKIFFNPIVEIGLSVSSSWNHRRDQV